MTQKIEKWDEINGAGSGKDRMEAFLDSATDTYAILRLRRVPETRYERFASMKELAQAGIEPEIDHYEVVYTAPLLPFKDRNTLLEGMYEKFNIARPEDFRGHSLSVSDIVALNQGGVVSCHYVDTIGFQELPGFLKPENYLQNTEMALEDDYGMIDGILNNGRKEERPSVLEQLRQEHRELSNRPGRTASELELEQ